MSYFTQDYLNFLSELANNNNRDWFNSHKKRFKDQVEAPFKAFLNDLIDRASALDPNISITPKEALFRIYRDTRFSKDKTPYKTHMSAVVAEGGRKGMKANGIYVQSSAEDFRIYSGFYMPQPKEVQLIREAITSDLVGFQSIIDNPDFKNKFGAVQGEEHKRIPKEFAAVYEKQPLLIKKSFYVFHKFEPEVVLRDDLVDLCMEYFVAARPFGQFFVDAVSRT